MDGMVDDLLPLMCSPSLISDERMMDLMLIEALLVVQRPDTERGTSSSLCHASQHSPMMPRSEAEQLVGQKLINALSDFKQLIAAPSLPKT
jgi:hypothetical protein